MNISAHVENMRGKHAVSVVTGSRSLPLDIPPKTEGAGSSVNGGELLFLALATCYCNDIYREANKRGIDVERVQVEVHGEFGAEGQGARNIRYGATIDAKASEEEILALMKHTDTVAEIQNTLRSASVVTLTHCEAREV